MWFGWKCKYKCIEFSMVLRYVFDAYDEGGRLVARLHARSLTRSVWQWMRWEQTRALQSLYIIRTYLVWHAMSHTPSFTYCSACSLLLNASGGGFRKIFFSCRIQKGVLCGSAKIKWKCYSHCYGYVWSAIFIRTLTPPHYANRQQEIKKNSNASHFLHHSLLQNRSRERTD